MDIPGLGGFRCVEKGVIFFVALVSKNHIGLGFWMGFDIWLRLGKHVMKRGWEEGVPALSGMHRWDPGSDGPGTRPKLSYVDFGLFGKVHHRLCNSRYAALVALML